MTIAIALHVTDTNLFSQEKQATHCSECYCFVFSQYHIIIYYAFQTTVKKNFGSS